MIQNIFLLIFILLISYILIINCSIEEKSNYINLKIVDSSSLNFKKNIVRRHHIFHKNNKKPKLKQK
jgi:hypothetical protein